MAFMYILLCGDGSYYTGSARDLAHRIDQHMSGEGCAYTKEHMPVSLVYHKEFDRITDAYAREKKFKAGHVKRNKL